MRRRKTFTLLLVLINRISAKVSHVVSTRICRPVVHTEDFYLRARGSGGTPLLLLGSRSMVLKDESRRPSLTLPGPSPCDYKQKIPYVPAHRSHSMIIFGTMHNCDHTPQTLTNHCTVPVLLFFQRIGRILVVSPYGLVVQAAFF